MTFPSPGSPEREMFVTGRGVLAVGYSALPFALPGPGPWQLGASGGASGGGAGRSGRGGVPRASPAANAQQLWRAGSEGGQRAGRRGRRSLQLEERAAGVSGRYELAGAGAPASSQRPGLHPRQARGHQGEELEEGLRPLSAGLCRGNEPGRGPSSLASPARWAQETRGTKAAPSFL